MTRARMIVASTRPRSMARARFQLDAGALPDYLARRLRARTGWRRWR